MEEDKTPNGTFTRVPNMFLETCDLPETAQILFLRLLRHYGHTGGVFTGSTRKLANLVHMSKSTVDRMSKRLRDADLIKLEYQLSKETEQEIMTITLNIAELWDTNRHHCKIEPVPIWDSTLPKRDGVLQSGTAQTNLGQDVPDVSEDSTQEDSKKILNTDKTVKTNIPLTISPQVQIFFTFWKAYRHRKSAATITAKNIEQYETLAAKIQTQEDFDSICALALSRLPSVNDGKLWLANLISCLDDWEMNKEQSQQTPEEQENDYWYPGMDIPANISRNVERACKKKWGMSVNRQALNETFKDIGIPPKSFILLLEEALERASDPDDVLVRMKQRVTSKIV